MELQEVVGYKVKGRWVETKLYGTQQEAISIYMHEMQKEAAICLASINDISSDDFFRAAQYKFDTYFRLMEMIEEIVELGTFFSAEWDSFVFGKAVKVRGEENG